MQGRYGVDSFSKFLLVVGLVVMLASSFFKGAAVRNILYILGIALIIYCYYRTLSRNVTKRYAENQAFAAKTSKIRGLFKKQVGEAKQKQNYHIYKCPSCKQKIRIPKGKGKIEVRCPKCGTTFVKKS